MNSPNEVPLGATEPATKDAVTRFDVIVKAPAGCDLGALLHRLIDSRAMFPASAERLVRQLRDQPQVRSSRMVSREQADKALRKLGAAGLEVVVTPAHRPGSAPSGPSGQSDRAPQNLLDDHELFSALQGRPRQAPDDAPAGPGWERARQPAAYPSSLRPAAAAARPRWTGAMLAVAGVAFAAGWWGPQVWRDTLGRDRAAASAAWAAREGSQGADDVDRLLTRLDEAVALDVVPAAGGASAVSASLLAEAAQQAPRQKPGTALRPPMTDALRVRWLADLAVGLAELGQGARAAEVLGALAGWRHNEDTTLSAAVRRADLMTRAWDLQHVGTEPLKVRVEALNSSVLALMDPAERADTLGEVATAMAVQPLLPTALADAFMAQAEGALKVIVDPARQAASSLVWSTHQGEVLLAEIRREAAAGHAATARALADRLARLPGANLPEVGVAHLLALHARAERMLGTPAAAKQAMLDALARVETLNDPMAQARGLRVLALDMLPADMAPWSAAVRRATARADALPSGNRATVQAELARAWADAGQADALVLATAHALQSPGLSAEASTRLGVDLLLGGELAQAMAHHRAGEFAQADAGLRTVAARLL